MTVSVSWDVVEMASKAAFVEIHKPTYVPMLFVEKILFAPWREIRRCASVHRINLMEIHWWNALLQTMMVLVVATQIAPSTCPVERGNVSILAVSEPRVDTMPFAKWFSIYRAANARIVTLVNLM
jgi:hypothetical protein